MATSKKVLFYVPEFPVITQTFIEKEIAKLAERQKIDVSVFAITKGKGELSPELCDRVVYKRISLFDGFSILPLLVFSFSRVTAAYNSLNNLNKPFFQKMFFFGKAVGYSTFVKKLNPDHIHAHFLSDASTMAMVFSIITDIPMSISAHAKDIFVNSELVSEKAHCAKFISVCNKNAWEKVKSLVRIEDREKIILQYHGSDLSFLEKSQINDKTQNNVPIILNVGRFEAKKGQEYLIEASALLKDRGIPHKVLIIGGGPLYESLKNKIEQFNVQDTVEIIGEDRGIPHSQVLIKMQSANIFALPSVQTELGDVEGVPNTLVEAAFYKIPLVSTNTGSIEEILRNGTNGIIVQEKSAQSLAEALKKLIENPELRIEYGENGHSLVLQDYDMAKNVVNLENSLSINL